MLNRHAHQRWTMALLVALLSATCAPIEPDDTTPLPGLPQFDLDDRLAEIEANGGVYQLLNGLEPTDIYLRIDDVGSPIYGASIRIPADIVALIDRGLLSLEPYGGPALSTSLGQLLAGPAIDTALVDPEVGAPISLPDLAARVDSPFSLAGFAPGKTTDGVFLGKAISEFANGLTDVAQRAFGSSPDTVAGQTGKFGVFAAFHDGSGSVTDDVDEEEEPPADPSAQLYFVRLEGTPNCTPPIGSVESNLVSEKVEYRILDTGLAEFTAFARQNGLAKTLDYRVQITGATLPLPSSTVASVDPGFPAGVTSFDFTIECENDTVTYSTRVSATTVTAPTALSPDVSIRQVSVSHWYTQFKDTNATCGASNQSCTTHRGWVWLRVGEPENGTGGTGLQLVDGSYVGKVAFDAYIPGYWEVLND